LKIEELEAKCCGCFHQTLQLGRKKQYSNLSSEGKLGKSFGKLWNGKQTKK